MDICHHADVVHLPIPGRSTYFVTHPEDIEEILIAQQGSFSKSRDYAILKEYMGDGLVTQEGEAWRTSRRLLQPSLTKATVASVSDLMRKETEVVADKWQNAGVIDLFADALALTISVMAQHLLGQDMRLEASAIRQAIDFCARHATTRAQSAIDVAAWIPTRAELRARRHSHTLRQLLHEALQAASQDATAAKLLASSTCDAQAQVEHLLNLFAAGYDTTGNALAWCIYELAKDEALQQRVRTALNDPAHGARYLQALVHETLRFYPTVPGVGRQCTQDVQWEDVTLPAGSTVFVFLYGMHHRSDFWPAPESFIPERFLRENKQNVSRKAYLPFGLGARMCIGSHFATQELGIALEYLLKRFRFSLADTRPVRAIPGISLSPSRTVQVRVTP